MDSEGTGVLGTQVCLLEAQNVAALQELVIVFDSSLPSAVRLQIVGVEAKRVSVKECNTWGGYQRGGRGFIFTTIRRWRTRSVTIGPARRCLVTGVAPAGHWREVGGERSLPELNSSESVS